MQRSFARSKWCTISCIHWMKSVSNARASKCYGVECVLSYCTHQSQNRRALVECILYHPWKVTVDNHSTRWAIWENLCSSLFFLNVSLRAHEKRNIPIERRDLFKPPVNHIIHDINVFERVIRHNHYYYFYYYYYYYYYVYMPAYTTSGSPPSSL